MPKFVQRPFPSANTVLLEDGIVVDPGDEHATLDATPAWILTTHWHSDHAGAVARLQSAGARVAVSAAEAEPIEAWTPAAGRRIWLRQRLDRYRVDRRLEPGNIVPAGAARWHVLALPGHTAEQVGFHDPAAGVVIAGDALHATDLGWLDLDADPAALDQAEATLDRLDRLRPRLALPGHGPAIHDVPAALAQARRRLASWRRDPARIVFHAAKRILTHALMTEDGLAEPALTPMLLDCPWLHDHARRLGEPPRAFVTLLLAEMLRSGAASWQDGWLVATGPYRGKGSVRVAAPVGRQLGQ